MDADRLWFLASPLAPAGDATEEIRGQVSGRSLPQQVTVRWPTRATLANVAAVPSR